MKKSLILAVALLFAAAGCCKNACTPEIPMNYSKVLLLDVRTVEEYNAGHIEGALNIPHTQIKEKIASAAPDLQQEIIIYCRSGRRAGQTIDELKKMGYKKLHNYKSVENTSKVMQRKIVK